MAKKSKQPRPFTSKKTQPPEDGITHTLSQLSLASKAESTPASRGGNRKKKRKDLADRFDAYFGDISKLENWQQLCRDLKIDPVPSSLTQCRAALRGKWVNIHDFLDHKRYGSELKFFKNERALAAYTIKEDKIYSKRLAKKGGPVRELLAHIF